MNKAIVPSKLLEIVPTIEIKLFIYAYELKLCLQVSYRAGINTTGRVVDFTTCLPRKYGDRPIPW